MNRPNTKFVLLVLIVNAAVLCAQSIGTIKRANKENPMTKAENGLIIAYGSGRSEFDAGADKVDIFDEHGHPVTSLNVLRPVEGARSVSIYDVSARPGGLIAVAAVYLSKEGDRKVAPAAALLLFDFNGRLLSAYALGPTREILLVALDENLNIWTLANASELENAIDPMIVEYTADGRVVKELLLRKMFPPAEIREPHRLGETSMGYASGVLWIWLSGSEDLVTVNTSDGTATITKTQLPKRANYNVVRLSQVYREPSGDLVAQFREDGQHGDYDLANYTWSPVTKLWSPFKPGACDGNRLMGVGDAGQLYIQRDADQDEICWFRRQ